MKYDTSKLRITVFAAAALPATALATAGEVRPAPSGQADAVSAINRLGADGYRAIVNRTGVSTAPLSDCSVSGPRPGADDSIVLVDVICDRDA